MKQIIEYIRKNFELSHHESLQVFWGLIALALLFVSYFFVDRLTSVEMEKVELKEYLAPEEVFQARSREVHEQRESAVRSFKADRDFTVFNPNTADKSTLISNHFPEFLADRLIKFRTSGMRFREKEDLLKIYGLRHQFYAELEPFIELPSAEEERQNGTFEVIYEEHEPKKVAFVRSEKVVEPFDINTATAENLEEIRGIGKVFATRILNYRESLGGFIDLNQLKSTYGLPDSTYNELVKVAYIGQAPRHFKINEVSIDQWPNGLLRFHKRKAIIAYREQHGGFNSAEDLKKVRILEPLEIKLLASYADFSKTLSEE